MDTPKIIAEQLHNLGLSDSEVAQRVGSSQPTIWRIRTGKSIDCSGSLYRKLVALRDDLTCQSLPPVRHAASEQAGCHQ